MSVPTAQWPSVRAAFAALIDYAGLFPPAQLQIEQAQNEYLAARQGPFSWMLGRFIIPAALLSGPGSSVLCGPFSLIVDPNVEAIDAAAASRRSHAEVEALEIPIAKTLSPLRTKISPDEALDAVGALEADLTVVGMRDLPAFVEIPPAAPWRDALEATMNALARVGLSAKLRCGGASADAFPSVDSVAEFVAAAAQAGVAFKATAGLHHPVRHRDRSTGFMMHGFLNILAASALAARGERELLTQVIAEEDAGAFVFANESFAWRNQVVSLAELEQTRRKLFVSYGSCSFSEPVDDLEALGLVSAR